MAVLDREEYIEQAYFFRVFRERLTEDLAAQDILGSLREEVLATTRLPIALDFLKGEMMLKGRMGAAMQQLAHYFTPFQTFVMCQAEEDATRFDTEMALTILEREAAYRGQAPSAAGLFVYQFESIARHRLGYDKGMAAMAADPFYPSEWQEWIRRIRFQVGGVEFSNLIYWRSEFFREQKERHQSGSGFFAATGRVEPTDEKASTETPPDASTERPGDEEKSAAVILFGRQEGRIARANRGKDPLYLFAALQRQLGYPAVPRVEKHGSQLKLHPELESRLSRLEQRLRLIEAEAGGKLDLSEFYAKNHPFVDSQGSEAK